jgi:hypothetical protein
MNIALKSAIAGVLSLSASGAFALGIPSLGNSDLILIVNDETSGATYALDTGTGLSTLMAGTLSAGAVLSTSLAGVNSSNSSSTTLQSFISTNQAKGDTLGWTLEGAQYAGGTPTASSTKSNSQGVGKALIAFSSDQGTSVPSSVSQYTLTNLEKFANGIQGDVVNASGGGLYALNNPTPVTETTNATYLNGVQKYTLMPGLTDLSTLGGSAVQLFGFTGEGDTGALSSYILGTATVSANGSLTITGNNASVVPVPAAVWLFGSGLMGLVGVSRRRKTAV